MRKGPKTKDNKRSLLVNRSKRPGTKIPSKKTFVKTLNPHTAKQVSLLQEKNATFGENLNEHTKKFLSDSQNKSMTLSGNTSLLKSKGGRKNEPVQGGEFERLERGDISSIYTCQTPVDMSFVPEGIKNLLTQAAVSTFD